VFGKGLQATRVGQAEIDKLRSDLSASEKRSLERATRFNADWIHKVGAEARRGRSMNRIARMPPAEQAEIFGETANRKGISENIVEKDFWVCWVLQQLFAMEALADRLLFKGGTSLSKIFHAINRFSEDIDLAVDYAALGFTHNGDPRQEGISRSRRTRILDEMMAVCREFIAGEFLTAFKARCLICSVRKTLGALTSARRTRMWFSFDILRLV
jgi:hypothetical protein